MDFFGCNIDVKKKAIPFSDWELLAYPFVKMVMAPNYSPQLLSHFQLQYPSYVEVLEVLAFWMNLS